MSVTDSQCENEGNLNMTSNDSGSDRPRDTKCNDFEMAHLYVLKWGFFDYQMKIHKNGPFKKNMNVYLCPSRLGKFEVSKRPLWTDLVHPSDRSTLPICKVNFTVQIRP